VFARRWIRVFSCWAALCERNNAFPCKGRNIFRHTIHVVIQFHSRGATFLVPRIRQACNFMRGHKRILLHGSATMHFHARGNAIIAPLCREYCNFIQDAKLFSFRSCAKHAILCEGISDFRPTSTSAVRFCTRGKALVRTTSVMGRKPAPGFISWSDSIF